MDKKNTLQILRLLAVFMILFVSTGKLEGLDVILHINVEPSGEVYVDGDGSHGSIFDSFELNHK